MEAATIHPHPAKGQSPGAKQEQPPLARGQPADPAPLGLAAFAMTTFVLSMFNSNLVNGKGLPVVLGLALVYGGIVQVLAGMWEFRTGNTFGAVAFCSYGAFWISFWALNVFYAKQIGGNAGHAVGVYLWAWAIFTAYMTVAALRTNGAVLLVFVLADRDIHTAGDRRGRCAHDGHPLGRLCRDRHGCRSLVRLLRGSGELHLRAGDRTHSAVAKAVRNGVRG